MPRCHWRVELVGIAVVLATLLVPGVAHAHAVGTSRGEYALQGRTLTVRLLFARAELVSLLPELDGDRDGSVSDRELRAAWPGLTDAIVARITFDAAAGTCRGTLQDAALEEGDGLSIGAAYLCTSDPQTLAATLGFLDLLPHGHRHLAAVAAGASGNTGRSVAPGIAYIGHAQLTITGTASNGLWAAMGLGRQAGRVFRLGVTRVLTEPDHLVFLIALLLVGGRSRSLLFALMAFAVGHAITLALSAIGGLSPIAALVGPAIALSVAYVGAENWFVTSADGRWLVAFPFGLTHGLGFAGSLQQMPLAPSQMPLALATLTGGAEAGQIAVVLVALPLVLLCRRLCCQQPRVADRVLKAASAVIAVVGLWWFVNRIV